MRGWGFQRFGWYRTGRSSRRIPRFRCRDCRRTCSRQTFSTTYYLKRPELQVRIAAGLAACSCHRQIARSETCAKTTVTRQAERLGRHAILFHARVRETHARIEESIVHDHFETFIERQDRALGIGTAVGAASWFVYDVDPAPHRGSGRRPDRKKDALAKASPSRSYVESIKRTFSGLIAGLAPSEHLVCRVDGRLDYLAAVTHRAIKGRIELEVHPNPERGPKGTPRSPEAIVRDRAMFPVDQLHQMLRHSCGDHKRETISFGRRLESIVGRVYLIATWKNFIKKYTERHPAHSTPAMRAGIARERWSWQRVLSRRLFATRVAVPVGARVLYEKRWTGALPKLDLKYAG